MSAVLAPRRGRGPWKQAEFAFLKTWGGKRVGAGRKSRSERPNVPHRARPKHFAAHPVHVTLRSMFRPLRSQHVFPTVCLALKGATKRDEKRFRILQFSVQWDHVHLVVEASDKRALSSGIASVSIRIARYVNELVSRRGRFWADRWHGRELTSPRQVRNALVYVLANFRKHAKTPLRGGVDAFSSSARFDGWRGVASGAALPRAGPAFHSAMVRHVVVSEAKTWLAGVGWRRAGLVGFREEPKSLSSRKGTCAAFAARRRDVRAAQRGARVRRLGTATRTSTA
jgi:REP element-mobilizing transposase RayT